MPTPHFKPGNCANPTGRPKGAKNKVRLDVADILSKAGFNPFVELVNLARKGEDDRIKLDATKELAGYVAPKLKSIEITSGEMLEKFQLVFNVGTNAENNVQREQDSEPISS